MALTEEEEFWWLQVVVYNKHCIVLYKFPGIEEYFT
jgi:hypothetical protein